MSDARHSPGALLVLLACALVGHLWMQSAGADPASHTDVHGHQATDADGGLEAAHDMAAGCIAVLVVAALVAPRVRVTLRRELVPKAIASQVTPRQPPRTPPRLARPPVEHGVLLRV